MGQGPATPFEEQLIKDVLKQIVIDHGTKAVKWIYEELEGESDKKLAPIWAQSIKDAAAKSSAQRGGGAALLVGAALLLGGKKRRR